MARGTSGSSTRTISRNIIPLKAMEVPRIKAQEFQIDHRMEDDAEAGHE